MKGKILDHTILCNVIGTLESHRIPQGDSWAARPPKTLLYIPSSCLGKKKRVSGWGFRFCCWCCMLPSFAVTTPRRKQPISATTTFAPIILLVLLAFLLVFATLWFKVQPDGHDLSYLKNPNLRDPSSPPAWINATRVKAAFVILTRNSELDGVRTAMRQLEARFNHKFNYPYIFLNDEPFTDDFKHLTASLTNAETKYGEAERWQFWLWICVVNIKDRLNTGRTLGLS